MSDKKVWSLLDDYFDDDLDEHGYGIRPNDISQMEKELNLFFSDGYKEFLRRYDYAELPGHIIYGYSSPRNSSPLETTVGSTKHYQLQNWPSIEDWYIVSDDGFGNPIGIDPEGKVWLSDHDSGFEKVKLADSFEEFLYKVLTETLYE